MAATKLTSRQLAEQLHTDPRKLRKFMRATGHGVGQGNRYAVPATKTQLNAIQKQFRRWAAPTE